MLHAHLSSPYIITRAKDERLGQQVVLMIERGDADEAMRVCRQVLPKYWQPRRIVVVDRLPMTQTGKPARAEAEKLVAEDEKRNGTHPHG